jgi:acyl carrier protein
MDRIEQALNEYIVRELMGGQPGARLDNDDPLIDDGIIDSLGIFTLIAFIEEHFGFKFEPEDVVLDNFRSVRTIARLVVTRQQEAPHGGPQLSSAATAKPAAASEVTAKATM